MALGYQDAPQAFRKSLDFKPGSANTHHNLGAALLAQGRYSEAPRTHPASHRPRQHHRRRSLQSRGSDGRARQGRRVHSELPRSHPPPTGSPRTLQRAWHGPCADGQATGSDSPSANSRPTQPQLAGPPLQQLAWLQATHPDEKIRNAAEAVRNAERAVRAVALAETADTLDALAAAYAEAGRFDEAARTIDRAPRAFALTSPPPPPRTLLQREASPRIDAGRARKR